MSQPSSDTQRRAVLVCGGRTFQTYLPIYTALKILKDLYLFDTLIHGAAHGADRWALKAAYALHFPHVLPFPADWTQYGPAAGPIRNRLMLLEHPILVLAFHDYLPNSKGTKDMVDLATAAHTPVVLLTSSSSLTEITSSLRFLSKLLHDVPPTS